jgi:hypothetical protein
METFDMISGLGLVFVVVGSSSSLSAAPGGGWSSTVGTRSR